MRFHFEPGEAETQLRLEDGDEVLPVSQWARLVPDRLVRGVDMIQQLIAAGQAIEDESVVLIDSDAIAGLSTAEAVALELPAMSDAVLALRPVGVLMKPKASIELVWKRPNGQNYIGAGRVGPWLKAGSLWTRLDKTRFQIAREVDRFNAAQEDDAARMTALEALTDLLPSAKTAGSADAPGLLGEMSIFVADAFSLDLKEDGDNLQLVPIPHSMRDDAETPLLPQQLQTAFGDDQFNRYSTVRGAYALGGRNYLVLTPNLRAVLTEVRKEQGKSNAVKRAWMASPRKFIEQALGQDAGGAVVERIFIDTPSYSDGVIGLGLWQPRILPWVALPANDWLGDGPAGDQRRKDQAQAGLMIGDRRIDLTSTQASELRQSVKEAMSRGQPTLEHRVGEELITVPATEAVLGALDQLEEARAGAEKSRSQPKQHETLLILTNENSIDIEDKFTPRIQLERRPPGGLTSKLKPHQLQGLDWLQHAWIGGRPGVLLADDMGLGKTVQTLAFLVWLRHGMVSGAVRRMPILVVAPTGLLRNWFEEHDKHLDAPGLGSCLHAYGRDLAALRGQDAGAEPSIDLAALRSADWVLTTYETLRDYQKDFGQVRFAVMLLDEAQKIKTPGIRLTDAAKAMNADFRIALTGTPIENRLCDLWCIVDTIDKGRLDDLRNFSAKYERNPDADTLKTLKRKLDVQPGGHAQLMLRRLRRDHLPDLPDCKEFATPVPMPPRQISAYVDTVRRAREDWNPGAMLATLQALRNISLHPLPDENLPDKDFIAASARLIATFEVLDAAAENHEKVLIFLESRKMQARMSGLIQRRYRLATPPMLINGAVAGANRQAQVNRFQSGAAGFDVMILSPKAAGVGFTLTAANHVIHLERWWNPAVEDQATGRAHRIGQTRDVFVHLPMAVLPDKDTAFDQNLHALLERKRERMRTVLCAPELEGTEQEELFRRSVDLD